MSLRETLSNYWYALPKLPPMERHELLRSNTGNPNTNPYGGRSPWTKKL